jgi:hypothetical protein
MLPMSLLTSAATIAQQASQVGAGSAPAHGSGGPNAFSVLAPNFEHAVVIGVIFALAVSCVAVLAFAVYINLWRRRAAGVAATRTVEVGQEQAAGRSGDASQGLPVTLETAEVLRILESEPVGAATADNGWRMLVEDVPGVGRIEWDPQTLRTFAYQPEVLYRLAFHRWRAQLGKLSEFDLTSHAAQVELSEELSEQRRRTIQLSRFVAPNSQGLRAQPQPQGQQATQAEE